MMSASFDQRMRSCAATWALCLAASLGLAMTSGMVSAQSLDVLIKAAKAEGELTFYSSQVDTVSKRVTDTFAAKFGIRSQFLRLSGAALHQRYAAEAEAGKTPADMIFAAGNAVAFAEDGIKKGWFEPISSASIPVVTAGEFPVKYLTGPTAVIQISPSNIVYNTDRVKGTDIPRDWPDLLHPRFKGQIIIPDPRASDATVALWLLLLDKYGESFLTQMRAQAGRQYVGGIPAIQALAAGEGAIMLPISAPPILELKDKGAPIHYFTPDYDTGVEIHVSLTARARANHPNAARLFAHYVMSREGNKVFNTEAGAYSVHDTAQLPKNYQSPRRDSGNYREQITRLLGYK